tara:strand:+ start:4399 stop:5067 length:669 start_codon:yes stop_codon:yes gene_type:complete
MDFDSMMNFGGGASKNFDPTQPLPFDPSKSGGGAAFFKANSRAQMAKLDFVLDHDSVGTATLGAVIGNKHADPLRVLDSNLTAQSAIAACTTAGAFEFTDGTSKVTLTCNQLPYNTFFNALGNAVFHISMLRIKVSDVAQLDKQFTVRRQTMFGYSAEQTIVISNFIDPDQNQSNVVDIPTSLVMDAETGVYIDIIDDATLTVSMFIDEFLKPASKEALAAY